MKSPIGSSPENTISGQFKKASRQASRLIIDLARCGLPEQMAIEQAERRFYGQDKIIALIIIRGDGTLIRHTL